MVWTHYTEPVSGARKTQTRATRAVTGAGTPWYERNFGGMSNLDRQKVMPKANQTRYQDRTYWNRQGKQAIAGGMPGAQNWYNQFMGTPGGRDLLAAQGFAPGAIGGGGGGIGGMPGGAGFGGAGGTGGFGGAGGISTGNPMVDKLINEYQSAMDSANQANQERYQEGKGELTDLRGRVMGALSNVGSQQAADIDRRSQEDLQAGLSDLTARGLRGSTVATSVQQRAQERKNEQLRRLAEELWQMRASADQSLTGNLVGFIERREDQAPDFGQLAQLAQMAGRYGGGGYGGGYGGGGNAGGYASVPVVTGMPRSGLGPQGSMPIVGGGMRGGGGRMQGGMPRLKQAAQGRALNEIFMNDVREGARGGGGESAFLERMRAETAANRDARILQQWEQGRGARGTTGSIPPPLVAPWEKPGGMQNPWDNAYSPPPMTSQAASGYHGTPLPDPNASATSGMRPMPTADMIGPYGQLNQYGRMSRRADMIERAGPTGPPTPGADQTHPYGLLGFPGGFGSGSPADRAKAKNLIEGTFGGTGSKNHKQLRKVGKTVLDRISSMF